MYGDNVRWEIDWVAVQSWGLKILAALAILVLTHFVAKAVQWGIAKLVDRIPPLKRHWNTSPDHTIGQQLGVLAYWLVWLVGLLVALQPLGLSQVLDPVRTLTTEVFAFLPRILGAGLIFLIGLIVATILRRVVEAALAAANVDGWLARARIGEVTGTSAAGALTMSKVIGLVVFVSIMLLVATAALEALQLDSLSGPLVSILDAVAYFLPRLVLAGIVIVVAFFLGRWAKSVAEQLLISLGFDHALQGSGIVPAGVSGAKIVGTVILTAIMLFAAIAAVEVLEIASLQLMLIQITDLGGRVLFGAIIIGVGVLLARILSGIVASTSGDDGFAPAIVRYAILALAIAMGLRFMGLANEIVTLAFGLVLGSAAIACALAFGLGGRPTAHKLLERWTDGGTKPKLPEPPRAPEPPTPPVPPRDI
jgi:hypothetical protein